MVVLRATLQYGRAVRFGEILRVAVKEWAMHETSQLRSSLTSALRTLERTGRVVTVASLRGESALGSRLFLPRVLRPSAAQWMPAHPLTFLEYVITCIDRVLSAASDMSLAAVAAPVGKTEAEVVFTTAQLRASMRGECADGISVAQARYGQDFAHPMTVVLALQKLAKGRPPYIEAVSGRRACWRLFGTMPYTPLANSFTLDVSASVFACDTDRVLEAARRTASRADTGQVSAADVAAEIALAPNLAPVGVVKVPALLSDLAKARIDDGSGRRVARVNRALQRLGSEGGRAMYWVQRPEDAAAPTLQQARVAFVARSIERLLSNRAFEDRLAAIEHAKSPIIALGRARQLVHELEKIAEQLKATGLGLALLPASIQNAEAHVTSLLAQVGGWIRFRTPVVAAPLRYRPVAAEGWTAEQLRAHLSPISPTAASMRSEGEVKAHYWRLIRRDPNPAFVNRRAPSSEQATEFLFDPYDARRYIAEQWGGAFCQLMSLEAEAELGDLRDREYVRHAFSGAAPAVRRRLIAATAFLGTEADAKMVRDLVSNDPDSSVRECALWALGMLEGDAARSHLETAAKLDPVGSVRSRALRALRLPGQWWWAM